LYIYIDMKAKYNPDIETSYEYTIKMQKEKYRNNPESNAWSKLKYYKKKFKNNEEFDEIMNKYNTNVERLDKVKEYNKDYKIKQKKY